MKSEKEHLYRDFMNDPSVMKKEYQAFLDAIYALKNTRSCIELSNETLRRRLIEYFECLSKQQQGKFDTKRLTTNPNLRESMCRIMPYTLRRNMRLAS